jgi:hypothetical protein
LVLEAVEVQTVSHLMVAAVVAVYALFVLLHPVNLYQLLLVLARQMGP